MSEDEILVFIVACVVTVIIWGRWFLHLLLISPPWIRERRRTMLWLSPLASAGALYFVLRNYASFDVKNDPTYILFYMVSGAAWVGLWALAFPVLGLSGRDDVLERRNSGAAWALSGALLGMTLSFAGSNVGDGPGWWVVVFCSLLSTTGFLAAWLVSDRIGHVVESITVDRDLASGIRFAGFLVAAGLILGRGAAGNWVSMDEAVSTFVRIAWPVVGLAVLAGVLDKAWRPIPEQPVRSVVGHGFLPAAAYIFCAGTYVISRGWW